MFSLISHHIVRVEIHCWKSFVGCAALNAVATFLNAVATILSLAGDIWGQVRGSETDTLLFVLIVLLYLYARGTSAETGLYLLS